MLLTASGLITLMTVLVSDKQPTVICHWIQWCYCYTCRTESVHRWHYTATTLFIFVVKLLMKLIYCYTHVWKPLLLRLRKQQVSGHLNYCFSLVMSKWKRYEERGRVDITAHFHHLLQESNFSINLILISKTCFTTWQKLIIIIL